MPDLRKLLKNRNNRLVFVISIIGIVIILLSGVSSGGDKTTTGKGEETGEEERLVEILQKIDGAGRVDVMITYEEKEKNGGIGYGDREYIKTPKGVIVVADGADIPSVRLSLKEAATAVMGVGANRVCVYKREE
mgnify:CR=1 FL=1